MRIGGIASGIDTQQIISDLMRAERIPMNKLFQQKEWFEWKRDAFRDVNLSLGKFRESFDKLRLQSSFKAFETTSSNPNSLTATGGSIAGNYQVQVASIAKLASYNSPSAIIIDGEQATSSTKVLSGGGDVEFKLETHVGEINISITSSDTFSSLANKISNAKITIDGEEKSLGIRASFDNTTGRFFVSSREMGEDKWFTITDVGGFNGVVGDYITGNGTQVDQPITGSDAIMKFNDILITSNKNNITVNGINMNLLKEDPNATITRDPVTQQVTDISAEVNTLRVNSNPNQVVDLVKEFVSSYNDLIDQLELKLTEPKYRSFQPLTKEQRDSMTEREADLWDEKAKSGLLRSDPILRSVLDNMRRHLSSPVEGLPSDQINSLAQLGITTSKDWRAGGRLVIDESKLREAILEKPDEVMNLFSKQPEEKGNIAQSGIGFRINELMNTSINRLRDQAGLPGSNSDTKSSIAKQLKTVNDQLALWERRLVGIEDRYWRQFTAMEKVVNQMNSQSAFIMQNMFGGMGVQ